MTRREWQRLRGLLAVLVLVAVAGCSAEPEEAERPRRADNRFPVPTAPSEAHPLGLKWNWRQAGTLSFARQTPGGATFYEVEWCEVEESPGERDWGRVDEVVATTAALGHQLMLKIRTGSCWATGGDADSVLDAAEQTTKRPSALPADLDAYAAFVRDVVNRYSVRGVREYAIENEIDTVNQWRGQVGDYAQLVPVAARAIREADGSARVLDAGLSSSVYGVLLARDLLDRGRGEEAVRVYNDYYERRVAGGMSRFPRVDSPRGLVSLLQDGKASRVLAAADVTAQLFDEGYFDAYQLHFYESSAVLPTVLDWVEATAGSDVDVEAWEVGVAWPGDSYDEQVHADEILRVVAELLAADVRRIVYLPLAYTPREGKKQVFRGLVEESGKELAAAEVYRSLVAATRGMTTASPLETDAVHGVVIDTPAGARAVLWSGASRSRVSLSDVPGGPTPVTTSPRLLSTDLPVGELLQAIEASAERGGAS